MKEFLVTLEIITEDYSLQELEKLLDLMLIVVHIILAILEVSAAKEAHLILPY